MPTNPFEPIAANVETMYTNIRDRYVRPAAPDLGNPLQLPTPDYSMTATRGMFIPQTALRDEATLVKQAHIFQFNPDTIEYDKEINYGRHQRLGYAHEIPFWVSGGAKIISFMLFLDATAGSNYRNNVMRTNNGYNNDNKLSTGAVIDLNDTRTSGQQTGRGLLDILAKLEALTYPMTKDSTDLVKFNFGQADVRSLDQFSNPPYVLFTYGSVAANVFVSRLTRKDVLFNRELNPIRTELTVTLEIIEAKVLDKSFILNRAGSAFSNSLNPIGR